MSMYLIYYNQVAHGVNELWLGVERHEDKHKPRALLLQHCVSVAPMAANATLRYGEDTDNRFM